MDAARIAPSIEALLPVGVRPRQLGVRTLLLGVLLGQAAHGPAHLTRVHQALLGLGEEDRRRLGVVVDWKRGPHALTYRQVERTFSLVVAALGKKDPDGAPTEVLQGILDALVEASVPPELRDAARSCGRLDRRRVLVHPAHEAHRRLCRPGGRLGAPQGRGPGEKDELFFGYYLSLATMVPDLDGAQVPELVRRMQIGSCDHDPVPKMTDVLVTMAKAEIPLGDVVADSGYAHRVPAHFALPLRQAGASLVMDLHPSDRGTQGTFEGAILCNGNLYCPATPKALFDIGPLCRGRARTRPRPTIGAQKSSVATSSDG